SDGEYKAMHVQQTPIYFDENGRPVIGYSQNTIVGDGRPRPLVATCKLLNGDNKFETIFYKNYVYESLQDILSKREIEVIKLLSKGESTKEIADHLNISDQTVAVHRKNIIKKTDLNSTAEIIAYCNRYRVF
ncbi:MAG: helix-turn-helix transcriptional regulator, partial [Winogradskyella sp.]|nr:helix-turn-helix transcriptional regulator [Winogradskyella sp.]